MNENVDLLKKALLESVLQEIKEIETVNMPDFSVSSKFKERIFNTYVKKKRTLPKRIIISIVAAAITCTIIMMSVSAIRTSFLDFIVDVFDGFAIFQIDDEFEKSAPRKIETVHSPLKSMLERGYYLTYHEINNMCIMSTFEDENGNLISFDQSILSDSFYTTAENGAYKEHYMGTLKIFYSIEHNQYIIYWIYNNYKFNLICGSATDWGEIERIIMETVYSEPVPFSEWGK